MSQLYGGIDLHGNNSVIALLQENDKAVEKPLYRRAGVWLTYLNVERSRLNGDDPTSTTLVPHTSRKGHTSSFCQPPAKIFFSVARDVV
jgi:hypothetical protein